MPSHSFESVIGDQFSEIAAWYELGLHERYEEIEVNSAVGHVAVKLEQAFVTAELAKDTCDESYTTTRDQLVHAEEIQSADQAYDAAYAQRQVFDDIYYDLLAYPTGSDYQAAVSKALEWVTQDLGDESELLPLASEICSFLSLEEGRHFVDLT